MEYHPKFHSTRAAKINYLRWKYRMDRKDKDSKINILIIILFVVMVILLLIELLKNLSDGHLI